MADELGLILQLILALLPKLSPSESDQITGAIMKLRKDKEAKRERFKKAVQEMDIPTLNALTAEFFD